MPAAPLFDVESLTRPVPGDDPAGVPLGLREKNLLKEYREEHDPNTLSADDLKDYALANKPRKVAEWGKVFDFGTEYLATKGKDLRLALQVTEAATHTAGFRGLRDSLTLLRRLCEDCWDALHPAIDDPTDADDVDGRLSLFGYLDEELKTPFFPNVLRDVPVLVVGEAKYSLRAARAAAGDTGGPLKAAYDAAVARASPAQLQAVAEADAYLVESMGEVAALCAALTAKAPGLAPGLGGLKSALIDCRNMTQEILRLRADGPSAAPAGGGGGAAESIGEAALSGGSRGGVRSRQGIYAQLLELAAALEAVEPHSPVPLLLRRAVELRDVPFPELVDFLTSDKRVLEFLRHPVEAAKPAGE